MLERIEVTDLALLEHAVLEPGPYFTVLTGETGAGKSLLLGAIEAITGARMQKDQIRTGRPRARVEALFDRPTDPTFPLEEDWIDPDEPELILSRELSREGRTVSRLNGRLLPLARLKAIGEALVAIHGQRDSQKIFEEKEHGPLLLRYALLDEAAKSTYRPYREALKQLKHIRNQLKKLGLSEQDRLKTLDLLQYQIDEIETVRPQADEELPLQKQIKRLRLFQRLAESLQRAATCLDGTEEGGGAVAWLKEAAQSLRSVGEVGQSLDRLIETMDRLSLEAQEASSQLDRLIQHVDFDPLVLEQAEHRLDQLNRLKHKYGPSLREVSEFLEKIQAEQQRLIDLEETLETLKAAEEAALAQLQTAGSAWQAVLKARGEALSRAINQELIDLAMPQAQFSINWIKRPFEQADALGLDGLAFQLAANLGEEPKPLARIASGGEAARILLAIKGVLAQVDPTPVMIFDEIDAGISGETSARVGEKLLELSRVAQVICVTHSGYLASLADTHYRIAKITSEGRTHTELTRLDRAGSRAEIARLLAGESERETALQLAESLLAKADEKRAQLR